MDRSYPLVADTLLAKPLSEELPLSAIGGFHGLTTPGLNVQQKRPTQPFIGLMSEPEPREPDAVVAMPRTQG